MDIRNSPLVPLIARSVALGCIIGASAAFNSAFAKHQHPGEVREYRTWEAVEAKATAWSQGRETGDHAGCPEYGDVLDSKDSNAESGKFVVGIPTDSHTYTMVYCANDYIPRVDRNIANDKNESDVIPRPARVTKRVTEDDVEEMDAQREWVKSRTAGLIVYMLNELGYMRRINEDAFEQGFQQYLELVSPSGNSSDTDTVRALKTLVTNWGSQ